MNMINALNNFSEIWSLFYYLLVPPKFKTDLASAIKIAFEINNFRKTDCTNFIFVVTDGLYPKEQQKYIKEKVMICENKSINVFGIGVGISPKGI